MTIIVCGGRTFDDKRFIFAALAAVHKKRPITLLRHGACRGADRISGEWAIANGIRVDVCPAGWATYGNSAGPLRNAYMLAKLPKPDGVVAFSGGTGTANMMALARAAGVPVWEPRLSHPPGEPQQQALNGLPDPGWVRLPTEEVERLKAEFRAKQEASRKAWRGKKNGWSSMSVR